MQKKSYCIAVKRCVRTSGFCSGCDHRDVVDNGGGKTGLFLENARLSSLGRAVMAIVMVPAWVQDEISGLLRTFV